MVSTGSTRCISPDALDGSRGIEHNRSQPGHSTCPDESRFVAEYIDDAPIANCDAAPSSVPAAPVMPYRTETCLWGVISVMTVWIFDPKD